MQARSSLVERSTVPRIPPFHGSVGPIRRAGKPPALSAASRTRLPGKPLRTLSADRSERALRSQGSWRHPCSLTGSRCSTALHALLAEDAVATSDAVLEERLEQHKDLKIVYLENGLRVVILPNRSPVDRFEAHLEVHAGSVDERVDEQGLAHLVEHVTFLGSRKRETLLGTGARSNAYTDFHHTVFHVHAPGTNGTTGRPMLPQVLDALAEIAFEPEFLPSRIEKERKAVTAEAQMMNTIEYRVDCQLLTYLHAENNLGCRFPIGKMDQVAKWDRETIMTFWARNYYPANVTLYLVGDFDVDAARGAVEEAFSRIPSMGVDANPNFRGASPALRSSIRPLQHMTLSPNESSLRPPVQHAWGCGPEASLATRQPAPVSVFRHRLLQLFQLSVFCKVPVQPMTRLEDLRRAFMIRVLLSVLQFRVNARYVEANPPFVSIELDHSDSGREGCAVSTLTVTAEPGDWRGAVRVATQEIRRLQHHGVTEGELSRYRTALLRDSEQLAEAADSTPSAEHLDFVMESLALGHAVLGPREAHAALAAVADGVRAEEVGKLARSLLSFASHYGREHELARELEAEPDLYAVPGPSVATAVVACVPTFSDATGQHAPGTIAVGRGASMTTSQHVDVPGLPEDLADRFNTNEIRDDDEEAPPEGAVRFEVSSNEIAEALAEVNEDDFVAKPEIQVPDALISEDELETLLRERQPRWIKPVRKQVEHPLALLDGSSVDTGMIRVAGSNGGDKTMESPSTSISRSDIIQRRLSNGIALNYKTTTNEPRAASLRLIAQGGRAREHPGLGSTGSVTVGVRALSESGTVADWQREQVELFCISKLINCVLEADEEHILMDLHVAVGDGGLAAALQLLHLLLERPVWESTAAERAKQMYASHARGLGSSLERATADRIMAAMLGADRQFREPSPEEIGALTLDHMRRAVEAQLDPANLELSVVGDFDPVELEDAVFKYLGTVEGFATASQGSDAAQEESYGGGSSGFPQAAAATVVDVEAEDARGEEELLKVQSRTVAPSTSSLDRETEFRSPPRSQRHTLWNLRDSDARGCAFIAGKAPARWRQNSLVPPQDEKESKMISFSKQSSSLSSSSSEGTSATQSDISSQTSFPFAADPWASKSPLQRSILLRRAHPLFPSVSLALLAEVVNSRLFTTVRDTLGLTYDVSFELAGFDRLPVGWWHVAVTSTPARIGEAMMASLRVLRTLRTQPITNRELQRARRTLLARQETDAKDNGYWLALLGNLQSEAVPGKSLDCLRDLRAMHEHVTVDDLYEMLQEFDFSDDAIFSCIGVSGRDPDAIREHPLVAEEAAPRLAPGNATDVDAFFSAVKNFMQHVNTSTTKKPE